MSDPSDLAATLRRFLANPKAKVGSVPVEIFPHDFVAALASALERGAAAEKVVAAVKLFNDHEEGDDAPWIATHAALATYNALKEASDG